MKYKFNSKKFRLPLFFALLFISIISIILLNRKEELMKPVVFNTPTSLNDFKSIKKTNEISYLIDDYVNFYETFADTLKVSDGYIFTKSQFSNSTFYTYIVKMSFSGEEIWSYKYETAGNDYRHNMVLLNNKVYFSSNVYGVLILNVDDGSVYEHNDSLKAFDIQKYGNDLLLIGYDEINVVDSELNILKSLKSSNLFTSEYKVYFDDIYVDLDNLYILATKESVATGSFSPVIYTFDSNFSFVDDLPINYTEDNEYLFENGYYSEYFNFIKDGDNFYQIGKDFHKVDKDGNDTILIDSRVANNHKFYGIVDIMSFGDFYITLDIEGDLLDNDLIQKETHAYLNVRNKEFDIVKKYKVNDTFVQFYSYPESMNIVDGNILVKWTDWATYEVYISEFEFSTESDMCSVISGTGSNIGDEIKCGEEEFYVIKNDGVNVKMMGKYNLLVGNAYERFILDEPYVATTYEEIELYLFGLQSFNEKLADGYVIDQVNYEENPDDGSYVLTDVLLAKSLDHKTGTVVCDKKESDCSDDELHFLAKEQGYFGDKTSYSIFDIGGDNGYTIMEFYPSDSFSYYIFDEPVTTEKEALLNNYVKDKLKSGYIYYFITLEDGTIFGVEFMSDYDAKYVFLDESVATERELLSNPKVYEYLQSGYYFVDAIKVEGGLIFGAYLSYSFEYRKTFLFENDYSSEDEILRSDEMTEYLDAGYYYISSVSDSNGNYIGAQFNKYDDRSFKTILFDETVTTSLLDIYNREDVKELLEQGYMIYDVNTINTSYSCSEDNAFCKYNYSSLVFVKYDMYDFVTVIVDNYVTSSTDILNNELVQAKINEGYELEEYLISRYRKYVVNDNGTASLSTSNHYFGVVLRKKIGTGSDDSSSTPYYAMEKLQPVVVRQDETALGAHGGATGAPEPVEIGVLDSLQVWGSGYTNIYASGFVDYEYRPDYIVHSYYHSYYNTLKNDGFNVLDVDSISVSEINSIVKEVSGNELPLEEWLYNMGSREDYDPISGGAYFILGSIKEHIPDDYSWLWKTTYWVKTYIPMSDYSVGDPLSGYVLFVDTLGDLCSTSYCAVAIGAGLRPVVTMSLSSIEFNVTTSTDGNGKVVPSSNMAIKGDTITFETVPNDGYVLKEVVVTDSLGNEIIYTDNKFEMPAADVTISATFEKIILIEPTISIVPNRYRNNPLDENVSFYVTITNPYDIPLTDVKVTSDSDFTSCFINCSVLENNIVEIPVLEAGSSISYSIFYYVTEVGTIKANVEILSANAESPYFFNHEEPYVANTEASTIALVQVCNVLDGDGNGGVNQYNLISYDLYGTALLDYWFTLKDNACVTLALETDITYNLYQLDRQEYKLISVEGLITSNEGSFILEPKEYNITFNNLYEKKNYFHSWNRVENDVTMNLDPS